MKTTDEILLFLIRNSYPESYMDPVSEDEIVPEDPATRLDTLLRRIAGPTMLLCLVHELEDFLGEPVSYRRHLQPLQDEGTLKFYGVLQEGDLDLARLREMFETPLRAKLQKDPTFDILDVTNGRILNGSGMDCVAYYVDSDDEDGYRSDPILADARNLGLFTALGKGSEEDASES